MKAAAQASKAVPQTANSRRAHLALPPLVACVAVVLVGCGNAIYAFQSSSAHSKLEEARELGAEKFATYEYTMATEYLAKASSEAAEADYGDAIAFAETSEGHADKAIRLSRDAHRGAGR